MLTEETDMVEKQYGNLEVKTCGATRKPEFPRTGLDQTETNPGWDTFLRIFLGRVRDKDFDPVRVGVFFTGVS